MVNGPIGQTEHNRIREHLESGAPLRREIRAAETMVSGSTTEAACGLGAVALGILGLAGILPVGFAAIATIAVGTALFLSGVAISANYSAIVSAAAGRKVAVRELGGGLTAEVIGGLGAIALGVLALVGISPIPLMGIAAITLGGALLFGSGVPEGLSNLPLAGTNASESAHRAIREATRAAAGAQLLIGLGAVALGILAILGVASLTLILVATISVGAAGLLSGGALTGRAATWLGY